MEPTRSVRPFEVVSEYIPSGDQPAAIAELAHRINAGETNVVLLGATGTGKSATTAWLIEQVQRPTLVLSHNKTLAAQLANEFRELMPNNAVEYFVSYYDYYQPEAYVPQTDTFIEKDSSVNAEVELSWGILDPVLEHWAKCDRPEPYTAGTWGPPSADRMIATAGRTWRRP